jgi:hypothetical protein
LRKLFEGYGYKPYFVEGHEPEKMHQLMAEALDATTLEIQRWVPITSEGGPAFSDRIVKTCDVMGNHVIVHAHGATF